MSYIPPHKKKNSRFDSLNNDTNNFFSVITNEKKNTESNNRFNRNYEGRNIESNNRFNRNYEQRNTESNNRFNRNYEQRNTESNNRFNRNYEQRNTESSNHFNTKYEGKNNEDQKEILKINKKQNLNEDSFLQEESVSKKEKELLEKEKQDLLDFLNE